FSVCGRQKLVEPSRTLEQLDVRAAIRDDSGADDVVRSNVRESIREVFGPNSPEFREHEHIRIWAGPMYINMDPHQVVEGTERGRRHRNPQRPHRAPQGEEGGDRGGWCSTSPVDLLRPA